LTEDEDFDEDDQTIAFFNFYESRSVQVEIILTDLDGMTKSYFIDFIIEVIVE
jgi:hypothetical protein